MKNYRPWERRLITTNDGKEHEADFPLILSASRATDIPAFYTDEFFHQLESGYFQRTNPFNGKKYFIGTEKVRFVVFWSKNPAPIIPRLEELDSKNIGYYFLFTLNNYEETDLEPGVTSFDERVSIFKKLSESLGKKRVVWRFDPLILANGIDTDNLISRIKKTGDALCKNTEKLIISFADVERYKKVKNNLKKEKVSYMDFNEKDIEKISRSLHDFNRKWNIDIRTCAEKYDLSDYGILPNKCIDDEIIKKISGNDRILVDFLNSRSNLKDHGMRKSCGCIYSKDVGEYNTCVHGCVYCYANTSNSAAQKNYAHRKEHGNQK